MHPVTLSGLCGLKGQDCQEAYREGFKLDYYK